MKLSVKRIVCLLATLSILWLQPACANVRLPRLLGDGVVLQRNVKLHVWGWADPGETVKIEFRGRTYKTRAEQDGKWKTSLPPQQPGGPDRMTVSGNNSVVLNEVYVGDVWICSGQSNMELPLARVQELYASDVLTSFNPYIRHFLVPDRYNFKNSEEDLPEGKWEPANPETVSEFTAVGYFFARELYERYQVPIGLINASLGGSPIEAWMSEDALKQFPEHFATALKFRDDSLIQRITEQDTKRSDAWYALLDVRDKGLDGGWAESDYNASQWRLMRLPVFWDEAGLGTESKPVNGAVWFRKEITLPADMAGKPAQLKMGRIVDADTTYVNGKAVGNVTYQYPPRNYEVPAGLLKAGRNVIAVRVTSNIERGGFIKDKPYRLSVGGMDIDLTGEWRYRVGATMEPLQPQTFIRWQPLGLYNAMIAPLLNHTIKGVIWYQGESNVLNRQEYAQTFPALIRDWRKHWNQDDFPFLFVQLPNYKAAQPQPSTGDWAEFREMQTAGLREPKTGMAVAIDLGEWNDVHPLNKKDVGRRLALAARKIAYGEKGVVYSGPVYKSMKVKKDRIVLSFTNIGNGLTARGGELSQFAIAGADKKFVWAKAQIEGNKIVVWSEAVPEPVAVRYAWADNPQGANLYNKEGLPAAPFRTDSF